MTEPQFILHHYEASPYAEKIRLLCGLAGLSWGSVLSPPMPPRPNVDPLSGGYRRIPIGQIGADIICDTHLIAIELAERANCPDISPLTIPEAVDTLVKRAEGDVFFSAIGSVKPLKVMLKLLSVFGPLGMFRFIKDRAGMMKSGSTRALKGEQAEATFSGFLADLDKALASTPFLSGDQPAYADFAVYHPIWLRTNVGGDALGDAYPNVRRWFERIPTIGHGAREELEAIHAFSAAKDHEPRPVPNSEPDAPFLNTLVSIAPSDYGCVPVVGVLVAQTPERYIVARDTVEFGMVHCHFPRAGYSVSAQ